MTTPEPAGEPTPPSFDKDRPSSGGSPYGGSPYDSPPADPYANPYAAQGGGGGQPYYSAPGPTDTALGMPPLAALGKRLLARIIDYLILLIVAVPLSIIAAVANSHDRQGLSVMAQVVSLFAAFLYEGLMLTRAGGQTVGKKVMKIRVANLADGSAPTEKSGWTRAAVWDLPAILCCGWQIVDALWCTWDQPYRQCLHDKAAKTVVVDAI
ncbi:putative RDD family membrane protein YckC [Streptacidiphilus sp. MAP12-20]|uniref:RDD family protein n=1 Tax=Streptacidiphilus sp. MAP12-20 TaxID=3156299 RepID=UPI0035163C95